MKKLIFFSYLFDPSDYLSYGYVPQPLIPLHSNKAEVRFRKEGTERKHLNYFFVPHINVPASSADKIHQHIR